MKVWAISDLHLGFSTGKWMDRFGEHWLGHHEKVKAAWLERITAEDLVLLPGDFSWAMKPKQVAEELDWLAALPGRKVLLKGNHDYWWPGSQKKLEELLPEGIYAMKKRALVIDDLPIVGVRGGDFFARETEDPEKVQANLIRERHEFVQSVQHLDSIYEGDRAPIALFHYPPFRLGSSESFFTRMVEDLSCSYCLYGHLHNAAEWERSFRGEQRGVRYRLVSCDALNFEPMLLDEA
ncbi:MAG: metallophosphoesterase [Planctomycetota bacterium]